MLKPDLILIKAIALHGCSCESSVSKGIIEELEEQTDIKYTKGTGRLVNYPKLIGSRAKIDNSICEF